MMKRLGWLMAVALLSGCDLLEPQSGEQRAFNDALAAWKRLDVESYSFVNRYSCECQEDWTRPALVTVRAGQVVGASDVANGETRNTDYYKTIDELFTQIKEAFDNRAWRVEVEYDSQMHYPKSVYIDHDRYVADEEFSLEVSDLTRIP